MLRSVHSLLEQKVSEANPLAPTWGQSRNRHSCRQHGHPDDRALRRRGLVPAGARSGSRLPRGSSGGRSRQSGVRRWPPPFFVQTARLAITLALLTHSPFVAAAAVAPPHPSRRMPVPVCRQVSFRLLSTPATWGIETAQGKPADGPGKQNDGSIPEGTLRNSACPVAGAPI
jgi:hypothetical protein